MKRRGAWRSSESCSSSSRCGCGCGCETGRPPVLRPLPPAPTPIYAKISAPSCSAGFVMVITPGGRPCFPTHPLLRFGSSSQARAWGARELTGTQGARRPYRQRAHPPATSSGEHTHRSAPWASPAPGAGRGSARRVAVLNLWGAAPLGVERPFHRGRLTHDSSKITAMK